jgi:hypothetical protein
MWMLSMELRSLSAQKSPGTLWKRPRTRVWVVDCALHEQRSSVAQHQQQQHTGQKYCKANALRGDRSPAQQPQTHTLPPYRLGLWKRGRGSITQRERDIYMAIRALEAWPRSTAGPGTTQRRMRNISRGGEGGGRRWPSVGVVPGPGAHPSGGGCGTPGR